MLMTKLSFRVPVSLSSISSTSSRSSSADGNSLQQENRDYFPTRSCSERWQYFIVCERLLQYYAAVAVVGSPVAAAAADDEPDDARDPTADAGHSSPR